MRQSNHNQIPAPGCLCVSKRTKAPILGSGGGKYAREEGEWHREERKGAIRKRKLGLPVIHRARECAPEVRRTGIRVLDDLLEKRTRPGGTPRRQPHPPPTTKNLPLPPSPTPYPYQNNRGRLTIVSRPPNVAPRGLEPRFKV